MLTLKEVYTDYQWVFNMKEVPFEIGIDLWSFKLFYLIVAIDALATEFLESFGINTTKIYRWLSIKLGGRKDDR